MKKIQNRTFLCILLCMVFVLGIIFFLFSYSMNTDNWTQENYYAAIGYTPVTNYDIIMSDSNENSNTTYYSDDSKKETLYVRGTIVDRNGVTLAVVNENGVSYNASATIRTSTLHAVGDKYANISTGALKSLSENFSRYITENGEYTANDNGNTVAITIDSSVNQLALNALGSYKGTVAVYNYKTGEILCMVSTPSFDPENVPSDIETNPAYDGAYLNRFYSSAFTPGSTMKVLTLEAAIDSIPDIFSQKFTCTGSYKIGNQYVNCTGVHGTQDIYDAFANSCNSAFAQIALQIPPDTMNKMVENGRFTKSYTIDDKIHTAKGSFDFLSGDNYQYAWSCIGLHKDLINPCSLMIYLGAVANGGSSAVPTTLYTVTNVDGEIIKTTDTNYTGKMIEPDTAQKMKEIMVSNTVNHGEHYQASRFNVEIGAKTGTVDRTDGGMNGWFVGFVNEEEYPYAFVVYVENGGYGVNVPGGIAATVINALCK
ncbi:MAG: penicillin-binding transpeptidase domain-containing protein [Lachnospiraceae bacterium]